MINLKWVQVINLHLYKSYLENFVSCIKQGHSVFFRLFVSPSASFEYKNNNNYDHAKTYVLNENQKYELTTNSGTAHFAPSFS